MCYLLSFQKNTRTNSIALAQPTILRDHWVTDLVSFSRNPRESRPLRHLRQKSFLVPFRVCIFVPWKFFHLPFGILGRQSERWVRRRMRDRSWKLVFYRFCFSLSLSEALSISDRLFILDDDWWIFISYWLSTCNSGSFCMN